ncbi:MAG: type VI secretion system tip protein TssI/VgrG [Polyangiaceae bacterium]
MMNNREASWPFSLELESHGASASRVITVRGSEALSRLYSYVVEVWVDDAVSFDETTLGAAARLRATGVTSDKVVNGIVTRVRARGPTQNGGLVFELRIAPRAWLLTQRRGTRVFQEKTVPEIVSELLSARGVNTLDRLGRRYPKRTYCVQYDETELGFVERLLAEEGIFYFFLHDQAEGEVLVLGDDAGAYEPVPDAYIPVRAHDLQAPEDCLTSLSPSLVIRPGTATIREFDFSRPSLRLTASANAGARPRRVDERELEVFAHYDDLEGADVSREAAAMHLDAYRRDATTYKGSGPSRRVFAGARFRTDAALPHDEFAIAACKISARAPLAGETRGATYDCTFRAVPSATVYRPKRPERRAQQTLETATVVGPKEDEVHVDELGRIKVRFHWDREGNDDDTRSCWVRVMQPWAGTGWGFQFLPRVGMEVVVQFMTGDTDKPVVLGALYNTEHPLPFSLPRARSKSGIRTRSTPRSAAYNELSFDDEAGKESIELHAARDLREHVVGARSAEIGASDSARVGGNKTVSVAKHLFMSAEESCTLSALGSLGLNGQDCQLDAEGNVSVTAERGALSLVAGGDASLDARDVDVRAAGDASLAAERALSVRAGNVEVAATEVAVAARAMRLRAAALELLANVSISGDELSIKMGRSTLKLSDEGVEIEAAKITLRASDSIEAAGGAASLVLDDDLEGIGGSATLLSSAAKLELGSTAKLEASSIALSSGGGASASDASLSNEEAAPPPKLELSVYVGAKAADERAGELVIRDAAGEELARRAGSTASRAVGGSLVFEVDPAELEGTIQVVYRLDDRELHVLGPANAALLRDQLAAKDLHRADRQRGHRPPTRHVVHTAAPEALPQPGTWGESSRFEAPRDDPKSRAVHADPEEET